MTGLWDVAAAPPLRLTHSGAMKSTPSFQYGAKEVWFVEFVKPTMWQIMRLKLEDGSLLWSFRGGPSPRKVLGNKRIVSMWPARGGPVLRDGKVYFKGDSKDIAWGQTRIRKGLSEKAKDLLRNEGLEVKAADEGLPQILLR